MLKIGVRAHDYGQDSPDALFARIAADGYTGIQLAFKKAITGVQQPSDVTPALLAQTQAALAAHALEVPVLGAYVELSMADEAQRKHHVEEFCAYLPIAKAIGAGCIGSETTQMHHQPGVTRKQALGCLLKSLKEILPAAQDLGVTVAIEPVYTHTMNTPELTREVLDAIDSPMLKVIFDPVNLLSPDQIPTQHQLWDRSFAAFGDRIAAVHLKGAALNTKGELVSAPFEQSVVDYPYVLDQIKSLDAPLYLLREEAQPSRAAQDLAFIRSML